MRKENPDLCKLCIHGHFYQPSRRDPFTGRLANEPGAAPYANWNERIAAECYAPNAEAGNLEQISFDLAPTLARWLDEAAPDTYERIMAADRSYGEAYGVGNALAQPVHHTILPLARRRDKICQVRWGIASFEHRFGHKPEGMWLPEMAVDYETLDILAAHGIRFTILSEEQMHGETNAGAGPYWIRLDQGRRIAVFVRDRGLSDAIAFQLPEPTHVGEWLLEQMERCCRSLGPQPHTPLLLAATDGETFGHHNRHGVESLKRLLRASNSFGYGTTTPGLYLRDHPLQAEVKIIENSAWSCAHGLARWVVGCGCTKGDSRWKGALRRALDNLAFNLDDVYSREAHELGADPWALRDDYIAIVLGQVNGPEFLSRNGLGHLGENESMRLLTLLEAQFHRQRMYTSCTFFFADLERPEPRYAIANAIRALALTYYATRDDLSRGFRRDLRVAVSTRTGRTADDMLDTILEGVLQ
jgi:hypothetical protein